MRTVRSLWTLFEASADRRQSAVALDFETHTVSFDQLRQDALRAAAWLAGLGVGAGDVVGLQTGKRAITYVLMLGCLRLGATYSPLDPVNPPARTARMLERLQPKVLLTSVEQENPYGAVVRLDVAGRCEPDGLGWPQPWAGPAPSDNALHPAYVMFTSGSTGEPKGAVIPQMGVISLMAWSQGLVGPADEERFTALNPMHFDNSVFDFYCGLVAGGTLVPIDTAASQPASWIERIAASGATLMFSVPTLMLLLDGIGGLSPARLPSVKTIMFGGEGYPVEQLRTLLGRFGGKARLVNVYGPTETSCICSSLEVTAAELDEASGGFVSLGRMHDGFTHAILGDEGQVVAPGDIGELWIGGGNVGLGYIRNGEETARRFRQDRFGAINYRSGDLVREDEAGRLWFHGRKDNQIKIAGHRVELEEVDHAVELFPGVRRSLTVLIERGGAAHLVTMFEAETAVDVAALGRHIEERLPHYMRPNRVMQLGALPTNANGKVDRLAAQQHALSRIETPPRAADTADTEESVRRAWESALGHARFSVNDSFFDVGGTSLALARVLSELSVQRPKALSMTDLFAHPTIARLTAFLDERPAVAAGDDHARRASQQQAALAKLRHRAGTVSRVVKP